MRKYNQEVFTLLFEIGESNQSAPEAMQRIVDLEQKILRETSAGNTDDKLVRGLISVVKHSAEYHLHSNKDGGTLNGVCSYWSQNKYWMRIAIDALIYSALIAIIVFSPVGAALAPIVAYLVDIGLGNAAQIAVVLLSGGWAAVNGSSVVDFIFDTLCNL